MRDLVGAQGPGDREDVDEVAGALVPEADLRVGVREDRVPLQDDLHRGAEGGERPLNFGHGAGGQRADVER